MMQLIEGAKRCWKAPRCQSIDTSASSFDCLLWSVPISDVDAIVIAICSTAAPTILLSAHNLSFSNRYMISCFAAPVYTSVQFIHTIFLTKQIRRQILLVQFFVANNYIASKCVVWILQRLWLLIEHKNDNDDKNDTNTRQYIVSV